MKLEFFGTYKNHIKKIGKNNKEYIELNCQEQLGNKNIKICVFNSKCIENLEMFKEGDNITVIFSTWYDKKTKNNVFFVKDIVAG